MMINMSSRNFDFPLEITAWPDMGSGCSSSPRVIFGLQSIAILLIIGAIQFALQHSLVSHEWISRLGQSLPINGRPS